MEKEEIVKLLTELFNLFVYAFKNSFKVEGRACRKEMCAFVLFAFLINVVLGAISFGLLSILASLVLLPAAVCVGVRRLHDLNYSGWYYLGISLIALIPLLGWLIAFAAGIALMAMKGIEGPNKYGEVSPNY